MLMAVVDVRVVRVGVSHRRVVVRMAVGFAGRIVRTVLVLVVFVVNVTVVVGHRLMVVFVFVPLGQVQPDPHAHERSGQEKCDRGPVCENHQRDRRPDEGGHREVRTRSGGAETAEGENE